MAALLERPRTQRLALVAVSALILLARMGRGTLANFDDCYYAEKAHEMLASGDWVTPHFSGMTRLDNPPLFLWMIAGLFRVFGQHDWAAILPSALAGVACVGVLHALAMRLGADPFRAWCGSVVLLTTSYFLKYADHAMLDVFLSLLFVLAMLAYRRAWEGSLQAWAAIGLLAGLGVMTKSILGVFPLAVAWLHLAWSRRWRVAFGPGVAVALVVTALVPAPWYAAQLRLHHDAFLREHVRWLLWERGFVIGRTGQTLASRMAYVTEIARIYWPWLPFALVGLWACLRTAFSPARAPDAGAVWSPRESARLLVLWPAFVIGAMSLAIEKKLWYVMSAFPALALLAGLAWARWARSETVRRRTVWTGFALLAIAGVVLVLTPWGLPPERQPDVQHMAEAARARVPEHDAILFAGGNYFAIAHQFVYYSGRRLDQRPPTSGDVRMALDQGRWVLFDAARRDSIVGADSLAYPAEAVSGNWSLVHVARTPAAP